MPKLTLKDIKIKSPGMQVKEEILKQFGNLEVFADKIGIYKNSLQKYLDSRKVGSDIFKLKLIHHLNKGYDQIVISEKNQLIQYVDLITENINKYNGKEDFKLLDKLQKLTLKYDLQLETAKMIRNLGMYNFYNNKPNTSVDLIRLSIDMSKKLYNYEMIFKFTSDLGLILYYENRYKLARKEMEDIENLNEKISIDPYYRCLYYYRTGNIYLELGKLRNARKMFETSMKFARDNYEIGKSIMNIGVTFKKEEKFSLAFDYYNMSLTKFAQDDFKNKGIIYNNIAELFRVQGLYEDALKNIEIAFKNLSNISEIDRFIFTQTYTQIMIDKGEPFEAIKLLLEFIQQCNDSNLYKKNVIEGIEILLHYTFVNSDISILNEIESILCKLVQFSSKINDEVEYDKDVKSLLCNIYLFRKERGIYNVQKINNTIADNIITSI